MANKTTTTTTPRTLAGELYRSLVSDKRDDGTVFWHLREGSPQWMTDAIHAAHGDMMPDDWRYYFCRQMASAWDDLDDDAGEDEMRDAASDIGADIHTSELTDWLGSRADRHEYVNEAVEESGIGCPEGGIIEAIQRGQAAEIREAGALLLAALVAEADDDEGGE